MDELCTFRAAAGCPHGWGTRPPLRDPRGWAREAGKQGGVLSGGFKTSWRKETQSTEVWLGTSTGQAGGISAQI